eukprot:3048176-Prymnesium_polylepis.1
MTLTIALKPYYAHSASRARVLACSKVLYSCTHNAFPRGSSCVRAHCGDAASRSRALVDHMHITWTWTPAQQRIIIVVSPGSGAIQQCMPSTWTPWSQVVTMIISDQQLDCSPVLSVINSLIVRLWPLFGRRRR